jgi:CheY-like chemotaxis protein
MSSLAAILSTTEPREQQTVSSDRSQEQTSLILVVDDDRSTRTLLKLAMEEEGYRVVDAKDGEQCLAVFGRLRPDMVLLDAIMPEMDGFTCCERLRELPESINTPILIITALDDQDSIDRAFAAGATDYITKPIYWAVLAQRVKRLLETSQALKQFERLRWQLDRQQQWQGLFSSIAPQLSQPFDLRQLLESIAVDLRMVADVERVVFYQKQNKRPGKRLICESVSPGYIAVGQLPPEENEWDAQYQAQYEHGQTIAISNLAQIELSPTARDRWEQLNTKSVVVAPILVQNRFWGVICVQQCRLIRFWQTWEIEQMTYLGHLLASAVYQAQLRQQLATRG